MILLSGVLLMISVISTTKVGAQDQLTSAKFRRVAKPIPNQYIVVLDDDTPSSEVASKAAELAATAGGSFSRVYRYALKGFSARMSESAAIAISVDSRVEFVEEDALASVGTTQTITYPEKGQWGLDRIDQTDLPVSGTYTYSQTGTGISAYVIDTGLRTTHQDFGGRASFGTDKVGDGQPANADCVNAFPYPHGHGTLVAGLIGGTDYGVAKSVNLIKVRVIGCDGFSVGSSIIDGIDWVTGNQVKPAVANMSLQLAGGVTAVDKAVRRSIAAGVTYVVIAGNFNQDASNTSPARVAQAITVGATGNDSFGADPISDQRASFSNFGTVLDLFAPGVHLPSSSAAADDAHHFDDGTSLSGPLVTGAVAQYLQVDSTACQSTVSEVITNNATPDRVTDPHGSPNKLLFIPATWPAPTYYSLSLNGTGYVDVPNAGLGVSLDITGPLTLEAWVRLNSNTTRQGIVEKYNPSAGAGTNDGGYGLRLLPSGKVRFFVFKNGVEYSSITGNTVLATGAWYHVAGVYDGAQLKIYVQGVSDATPVTPLYTPQAGTTNLKIGASPEVGGYFLSGLIDEVRVTARAVYTANFTTQHKLTGVVDTKGLWRFDRQTAKDCADIHNGTLVGGAGFSTIVP